MDMPAPSSSLTDPTSPGTDMRRENRNPTAIPWLSAGGFHHGLRGGYGIQQSPGRR
jgi:hypothetical protein